MDEIRSRRERERQRLLRKKKIRRQRRIAITVFTILLILVIMMIFLVARTFKHEDHHELAGTWSPDLVTFYYFYDDGTGLLKTSLSGYDFTYTAEDGALMIDFADEKVNDASYHYEITEDPVTVVLTSYDGTEITMTRQP